MADIAVTATAVQVSTDGTDPTLTKDVTFGVTIVAGEWVYLDTSDSNKAKKADNNGAAALAVVAGMALNGGAAGQPGRIAYGGPITMNAALTAGTFYYLSENAGLMCPVADLGVGERVVQLGYATSTTVLRIVLLATGVTL